MAIYSCAVSTVGRSTHAPGTAGAHLRYIGRADAVSEIEAAHMPAKPEEARTWMDGQEREARKNARLCSKIRLALPRELTHAQNAALMREFLTDLTGGRVPWFYAIHDKGKDAHNPHAHLVVIDRDIETGKRVLLLSDSPKDRERAGLTGNGVEWIRERWEHCANQALARAGHDTRIDRRSLAAQGVDREPTIHIGPRANLIDQTVTRPESKIVPSPTPRHPDRVIDYPMIDAGRTRRERNAEIIDLNLEKAVRSPDYETRLWAQFERDQRMQDRPVEAQVIASARRRTLEERRLRDTFKVRLKEARGRRNAEVALSRAWTNQKLAPEIADLEARQATEQERMRRQQGRLFARFIAAIDVTGKTRRKYKTAVQVLEQRHRQERRLLASRLREVRALQFKAVRTRYEPEIEELKQGRRQQVAALKDRHRDELRRDDALLQSRETDRERDRMILRDHLEKWKRVQRHGSAPDGRTGSRLEQGWRNKEGTSPDRSAEHNPGQRGPGVARDDGPQPDGPGLPPRFRRR